MKFPSWGDPASEDYYKEKEIQKDAMKLSLQILIIYLDISEKEKRLLRDILKGVEDDQVHRFIDHLASVINYHIGQTGLENCQACAVSEEQKCN